MLTETLPSSKAKKSHCSRTTVEERPADNGSFLVIDEFCQTDHFSSRHFTLAL